ncbi:MAG: glycosyltransferase family 4 protein [Patescibacteria group bacterium]
MKKLKIAQLVLPWLPLPPPGYAGTERVVYNLTEGLVKKGHDVTLFSVGESRTTGKLKYILPKALNLQVDVMGMQKTSFLPLMHVANCFEMHQDFDIIHSHAQFLGLPFAAITKTPSVHTFHRVFEFKLSDERELVLRYGRLHFTSISSAQRISGINFIATVYNGTDVNLYRPGSFVKRDHLFWAGRLIEKKGPEEAIQVAKKLEIPLLMAGEITEPEYYENKIKPHVDGKFIRLIEEITPEEIISLYRDALVTLVPIKWNEPFGLVPVESMACGTPVVAYANGGVVETVIDGVTGYLVKENVGVGGLAEKVKVIAQKSAVDYALMSQNCRDHIVTNFSVEKMVADYEKVYFRLIDEFNHRT